MILQHVQTGGRLRIEVEDRERGESFWITAYVRGDRVVFQRLGPQMFLTGKTPRQIERLIAFGTAATGGYGKRMIGRLPPAADRVAELCSGAPNEGKLDPARPRKKRPLKSNQAYYRSLLGGAATTEIEAWLHRHRALARRPTSQTVRSD